MDLTGWIMAYEEGQLSGDEKIEFFQELVDSGLAWQLQGAYGREAQRMIDAGYIHRAQPKEIISGKVSMRDAHLGANRE